MEDSKAENNTRDSLVSVERPRVTAVISLPIVEFTEPNDSNPRRVRLTMHTDNLRILLGALFVTPQLAFLRVEGRGISDQQFNILSQHPRYSFNMRGRLERVRLSDTIDQLVYAFPGDLTFNPQETRSLLDSPFTPTSLSQEIGFKTVYFNAGDLVKKWQSDGLVNDFLPQFGGINELCIGSDSLSQTELDAVAATITARFITEQVSFLGPASSGFNSLNTLYRAAKYQSISLGNLPHNTARVFSPPNLTSYNLPKTIKDNINKINSFKKI